MITDELATLIRHRRAALHLSRAAFGAPGGYGGQTVEDWENGIGLRRFARILTCLEEAGIELRAEPLDPKLLTPR